MIIINLYYTSHSLEKMDALGIERKEIEKILKKGMKWQKENKWHSSMYGIEIVFQKKENNIIIITVYLSRRKK